MEIMRLVVTGPVGAGKSTFIHSVSEIAVVDTDRRATDETALLKQKNNGRLRFWAVVVWTRNGTASLWHPQTSAV